jgi:hypothetical protein
VNTLRPDLREAARLLDAGMRIVKLKPNLKEPEGNDWNHRPVSSIDPEATGYGLLLQQNKVCSVDPDNNDLAVIGMRALGFDLEQIMSAGVRTRSTRTGSGGRSAFAAEGEICWIKFSSDPTGTVLELRAHSENLQDTIPGLVYVTKAGEVCTQTYANCRRLDEVPPLPDDLFAWWEKCSTDIEFLREQQRMFFAAIGTKAHESISTGKSGGKLAFDAPGVRGNFNAKHDVPAILTRHNYGFDKKTQRWFPPTATGEPGVRPIPGKDGLWRSDHASDPLSGTFDAWIAYVVLDHKCNLDAAVAQWKKDNPMFGNEQHRHAQEGHQGAAGGPAAGGGKPSARERLRAFIVTEDKVKGMTETRMIWRNLIASGHVSVWAAPGNGGKTTIAKLAASELAAAGYEVLFFQEDAGSGDLPALFEHAKANGYQLLNSILTGSHPEDQVNLLREMVAEGTDLSGTVMFFDTLKKYLDLMSKSGARWFFALMRALTLRGATIVLLGHTNKNRGLDGKLQFEGVGDVRNDVDELLYIESAGRDGAGLVVMTIKPDKVRCIVNEATFQLDTSTMVVRAMPDVVDVLAMMRRREQLKEDAELIGVVRSVLAGGGMSKTALVERVVAEAGVGKRPAAAVVNRYVGTTPDDPNALWLETYYRTNNVHYISLKPVHEGAP